MLRATRGEAALLLVLLVAPSASAQSNGQLWTNVMLEWLPSERATYQIDLEPKGQVVAASGQPLWMNLDVTPNASYTLFPWLDVVGELTAGYTNQTNEDNTAEVTVRGGLQFSILSRAVRPRIEGNRSADREKLPLRRGVFNTLVRVERRNIVHGGSVATSSSWRLRDRVDFDYPLNRPKLTDDGAVYFTSDTEVFLPFGSDVASRVDQVRLRAGVGYRQSFAWRFEALCIWSATREPGVSRFSRSFGAIDVRLKRVF